MLPEDALQISHEVLLLHLDSCWWNHVKAHSLQISCKHLMFSDQKLGLESYCCKAVGVQGVIYKVHDTFLYITAMVLMVSTGQQLNTWRFHRLIFLPLTSNHIGIFSSHLTTVKHLKSEEGSHLRIATGKESSVSMGGSLPGSADRCPYWHFLFCGIYLASVNLTLTSLFLWGFQGSRRLCACRRVTDSTKQQGN